MVPMGLWAGCQGIIGNRNHPLVGLMRKYRQTAPGIAFEGPVGSYRGHAPLRDQLEFALTMGASWVQLWHHDVVYDDYADTLNEYRLRLGNPRE